MKRVFLICLGVLSAASAGLYSTLPNRQSKGPVLTWITQVDPVKLETIEQFKLWRKDRGLPPVEVKIDNVNQDPSKKLAQGLAGVGADLMDIYVFETELFAGSGILMDLTAPAKAMGFGPDATYPALHSDLVINGRQFGFPRNAGGNLIWINQDTFAKYGIPEPSDHWTWDEFERLGIQFVKAANPPGSHQRSYFVPVIYPEMLRRGLGYSIFNETMTRCTLDDPRNVEVMRRIKRWQGELHLVPTYVESKTLAADVGRSGDEWFYLYAKGRYALLFVDRWALIRTREMEPTRTRVVEPFTSGWPNMDFGCGVIGVYSGTKHPKEALEFMQYLTSDRFNRLIARSGDSLPPVPKYIQTEEFLRTPGHPEEWEMEKVFARAAPEIGIAYPRSLFVQTGALYRPITGIDNQVIDAVVAGRLAPEDAGRVEAQRIDTEIALNVRGDPKLKRQYDELVKMQEKIDALRAAGKPIPAAWITNPFHLAYYKAKGWLLEEPKS